MISINLIYIVVIGFIIVFTIIYLIVECYKATYMETEEHARNARIRQERISRKQSKDVENDEWI